MVDARLSADWLGSIKFDDLTDRAFRVFAGALMWSNKHGTDGLIPRRYIRYLHPDGDDPDASAELIAAGLWIEAEAGYQLIGWSDELHQSTAAEVERYKESARIRQRAYRERRKTSTPSVPSPVLESDDTSYARGYVTRDVMTTGTLNVGEGSGVNRTGVSGRAYAVGDVTRYVPQRRSRESDERSPFCSSHPHGTIEPCGPCARARVGYESAAIDLHIGQPKRPWDCQVDGHKYVTDGSCAVCEIGPSWRAS